MREEVRKTLARFQSPGNVRVLTRKLTFDDGASEILEALHRQKADLAPTLAFIDPFGFTDTPLDLTCRLTNFASCEVLFTFMFDHINRFLEKETVANHLQSLFGTDGFQIATSKTGHERKQYLRDLFRDQLKKECGFKYVTSFEMVNLQGNSVYFLFHGTRSHKGLEVMKNALWKIDPAGGFRFQDRFAGQEVLFGGDTVDVSPLRRAILERFSGVDVDVKTIAKFVLIETPYNANQWKYKVLRPLEEEGLVSALTPRSRRFSYPNGTKLRFGSLRSPAGNDSLQ